MIFPFYGEADNLRAKNIVYFMVSKIPYMRCFSFTNCRSICREGGSLADGPCSIGEAVPFDLLRTWNSVIGLEDHCLSLCPEAFFTLFEI